MLLLDMKYYFNDSLKNLGIERLKVVDCQIFSKIWSDTVRSVLVCGKEQESRKK